MALKECCRESVPGSILVLKDPDGGPSQFRMRIEAMQVAHVRAYKVDNCQIKDGLRCDYLVLPNGRSAVFIELKGSDVEKGIGQLASSMKTLSTDVAGRIKFAVLVPTRCPLPPYQTQKAIDTFRRSLDCRLRIDNMVHSCSASDF